MNIVMDPYLIEAAITDKTKAIMPLHLQGAFAELGHGKGDFPVSKDIAARCLSLPMSPYLSENHQKHISSAIKME